MSEGGKLKRRLILLALLGGAALFVGAGLLLWEVLPRTIGGATGVSAGVAEYLAPEDIPVVLPEARVDGVRVSVIEGAPGNADFTFPGHYDEEIAWWRKWLKDAGAVEVAPAAAQVLVIPLGECLGPPARRLIADHLEKGGGIVSTGPFGTRDGNCAVSPDTVLNALIRSPDGRPAYAWPVEGSSHMVFLGETMVSADIPAGARIDLKPAMHLVFRGTQREVYFANFVRRPQPANGETFFDGAVARSLAGNGRVVAFGFGLSETLPGWSDAIIKLAARNAINWAAGRPVAQLKTWPDHYLAAAMIAQDVEADYSNAADAIALLENADVPTTYFIVGNLARIHPRITRSMVRKGELATHSYHHRPMDRYTDAEQKEELELSKRTAEEYVDVPVRGFRPPEERFNMQTLRAWAEVGGDYFFAVDQGRSAAPVIIPFGTDSLVFFGRVIEDDFSLLSHEEMRDRGAMVQSLVRQLDEVIGYRGAYMFSYHSHMLAQEQLLPVLQEVVEAIKRRPEVWLATVGDLASWWRARAAIEIVVADDGQSAVLKNQGIGPFARGTLLVDLADGQRIPVMIPELAPGEEAVLTWLSPPRTGP